MIRCCCDKVSIYLNVTSDKKLAPCFIGPFSIVQWVRPLANLGTHYNHVHSIFQVFLLKPFCAGGYGYPQLCMLKMGKSGNSVGYLDAKD